MPLDSLTWHRGSILPFASLWHTVLRAAALNALRPQDLHDVAGAPRIQTASGFPSKANLLFNETADRTVPTAVLIGGFAAALGEPVSIFDWSHLGKLPSVLRFLAHRAFRVCPMCLANGFHSALFSLRLLQACPIHACALFQTCACGRPFSPLLTMTVLRDRGYCGCSRMRLFTRQTCRRPTMSEADTRALRPVAQWLDRLATVGISWDSGDHRCRPAQNQTWTRDVAHWCAELELGYPDCFVSPPQPRAGLTATRHECGIVPSRCPTKPVLQRFRGRLWARDPCTTVYRSFSRYLRRHVTRGTSRIVERMLSNPDPIAIAELIRSDRRALVGFAELAWALSIEPEILNRRWPTRPLEREQWYCGKASAFNLHPSVELDQIRRQWVAYHAGESVVLSLWIAAQQQAYAAAQSGVACWRLDPWTELQNWSTMAASTRLRFAVLQCDSPRNWTLPLPDKQRRQAAALEKSRARLAQIQAQCQGPCLAWSESRGWGVDESITPHEMPIATHRLLGVGSERSRFWLFQVGAVFVARACELRLQTRGFSPGEAICNLRSAVKQHRARYPTRAPIEVAVSQVTSIVDSGLAEYQQLVACIVHDHGWQGGARMIHQSALAYLAHRSDRQDKACTAGWV